VAGIGKSKLSSLYQLSSPCSQRVFLACGSGSPVPSGTIRPRNGTFCLHLSRRIVPKNSTEKKSFGKSFESQSTSRNIQNPLATIAGNFPNPIHLPSNGFRKREQLLGFRKIGNSGDPAPTIHETTNSLLPILFCT
jgi:hypothetical protein